MKVIAVIPARLASTRLPRKMLREIEGIPLVVRVYQAVRSSPLLADVIIATDSEEILNVCRKHSCTARMTSDKHRSGTERVQEISQSLSSDVYINVQGDEPMVRAEQIETLIKLMSDSDVQVGTLKAPAAAEDVSTPNAVKVVTDLNGRALYFSRSTVPFDRDGTQPSYFKHLGIYGYRKPALDKFVRLPESSLERAERLEQLRFLENGTAIYVAETPHDSIGIDTDEDLARVTRLLTQSQ
jgi:3-deoxy-manno-octulosonate cytidylyltransferase (CMP-KDO synthetase)